MLQPRPILVHGRLAEVLNVPAVQPGGEAQFTEWYEAMLRQECARADHVRESYWTEAAAVGGRDWVQALASRFPTSWRTVEPAEPAPTGQVVAESAAGTYILRLSGRRREGMLDVLGR